MSRRDTFLAELTLRPAGLAPARAPDAPGPAGDPQSHRGGVRGRAANGLTPSAGDCRELSNVVKDGL